MRSCVAVFVEPVARQFGVEDVHEVGQCVQAVQVREDVLRDDVETVGQAVFFFGEFIDAVMVLGDAVRVEVDLGAEPADGQQSPKFVL